MPSSWGSIGMVAEPFFLSVGASRARVLLSTPEPALRLSPALVLNVSAVFLSSVCCVPVIFSPPYRVLFDLFLNFSMRLFYPTPPRRISESLNIL